MIHQQLCRAKVINARSCLLLLYFQGWDEQPPDPGRPLLKHHYLCCHRVDVCPGRAGVQCKVCASCCLTASSYSYMQPYSALLTFTGFCLAAFNCYPPGCVNPKRWFQQQAWQTQENSRGGLRSSLEAFTRPCSGQQAMVWHKTRCQLTQNKHQMVCAFWSR